MSVASKTSSRRRWPLAAFAALALFALLALRWELLVFGSTLAFAEERPLLLREAEWGKPVPAFEQRFGAGTSEPEMLDWLIDSEFEVDHQSGRASRTIRRLSCNELVQVSWTAAGGIMRESSAVILEAGCL